MGSRFRRSSVSSISSQRRSRATRSISRSSVERGGSTSTSSLGGNHDSAPSRLAPYPWGPASAGAVGQHGARKHRARGRNACPGLLLFFSVESAHPRKVLRTFLGLLVRTSLRSSKVQGPSRLRLSGLRCSSDRRGA